MMAEPMAYKRLAGAAAGTALVLVAACAQPANQPTDVSAAGAILVAAADGGLDADLYAPGGSGYGSYLAGLFAGRQQDLSVAADFMLDALAQDPDNPQLLNRAFMLVASDGRHDKSVELAQILSGTAANNGLAALVLGTEAAAEGVGAVHGAVLCGLRARSTPIIELRETSSANWSSLQPSVPSGRSGTTR